MKLIHTSSSFDTKALDSPASINLRPPPMDSHKSFDDNDTSTIPAAKKTNVAPEISVKSYSIADLQLATGSFNVENLLGEGSFGRVFRAQFDDGKVLFTFYLYLKLEVIMVCLVANYDLSDMLTHSL